MYKQQEPSSSIDVGYTDRCIASSEWNIPAHVISGSSVLPTGSVVGDTALEMMTNPYSETPSMTSSPYNKSLIISIFDTPILSYDTIHLCIPCIHDVRTTDLIFEKTTTYPPHSDQPKRRRTGIYSQGGATYKTYMLKNLIVRVRPTSVVIDGSISKFLNGENVTPISLGDLEYAFNQLSNILDIDVLSGDVTRIDIAANMKMNYPVAAYFPLLASMPRCQREVYDNETLYFKTKTSKTLLFYDKIAELLVNERHSEVSSPSHERNILRYEYQCNKIENIKSSFPDGLPIRELSSPVTYERMIRLWKSEYDKIMKDTSGFSDFLQTHEPSEIRDRIMAEGIRAIGGLDRVMEHVKAGVKCGRITRQQKSQVKQKLKSVLQGGLSSERCDLLGELDCKIESVFLNSREQGLAVAEPDP